MKIKLKPYNKIYIKYFQKEKRNLIKLGKFEIYHIGSTSIPNMLGKGEIDILVLVKNKKIRDNLTKKLKKVGYVSSKIGDKNRLFFSKGNRPVYNLHLMTQDYKKARNQIKFRDYILRNPKEAKRYMNLKKEALKKSKGDRKEYKNLKNNYFNKIIRELKWKRKKY